MDNFINLHNHTSHSDGIGSLDAFFERVKELKQHAVAITDHGTLSGAMAFMRTAKKYGIKPIIGVEGYMIDLTSNTFFHITLLAASYKGFENLIKLNNAGHHSLHKKPAFTLQQLVDYNEGIIVLSGCPDGVPVKGESLFVEEFALTLKEVFGDRFYAEVMFSMPNVWKKQLAFADEFDLPFVFTADAHFLRPGDDRLHSAMNKLLRGYNFPNSSLYLHSYNEIVARAIKNGFPAYRIEDGIRTTIEIANKVEEFEVSHPVELPAPKRAKDDLLWAITVKRKEMIDDGIWNKEYKDRLKHEIEVITDMKFWDYFWMVKEVVDYGKSQSIALGHGRGSAAGSLVVYMLGITDVDPIKYDLIFERFLNIARKGVVDIDLDWQADRRDEIIDYAHKKWEALPLITISTYSHKSLLNDLVKVFSIPAKTKKKLEDENSIELKQFMIDEPEFAHAYNTLIGGVRHRGKHASGFAIGKNKTIPVERMKGNALSYGVPLASSQYDDLTPFGYTKFDLLGLTSLSALARMKEISGAEVK